MKRGSDESKECSLNKALWILLPFAAIPSLAFANVVWPGLFLAQRMALWAIPVGIVVETYFFKKSKGLGIWRTLWIISVINLFSTIVGVIGVAVGGLAWEAVVGYVLFKISNIGTFNPLTWLFTIALAIYLSYFFEIKALKWFFKIELNKKEKRFFVIANTVSTLVAFGSFFI